MAKTVTFTRRDDLCGGMFKFKNITMEDLMKIAQELELLTSKMTITQLRDCGEDMKCIEFRRTIIPGSRNFRTVMHGLGQYLRGTHGDTLVGWDVAAPVYLAE